MSKYNLSWNEDKIRRYIKEGRGKGVGKEYKPWITIHDFPSEGLSSRQPGWKSSRVYHFMSTNELRFFFILEWSDIVIDIREQFPMDLDETLEIAEKIGIAHPMDRKSKIPYVMTTDFMINVRENGKEKNVARTIKPASELEKNNVLEHFEIERRYWKEKGIDWGIVSDKDIPKVLTANIEWVYYSKNLEPNEEMGTNDLLALGELLKDRFESRTGKIVGLANDFDKEMNIELGTALSIFKHLVAKKEILLDMESELCVVSSTDSIRKIIKKNDRMMTL